MGAVGCARVRVLAEVGQPGGFAGGRGGGARGWRVVGASHTELQSGAEKIQGGDLSGGKAGPAATLVDGRLMMSDLEAGAAVGYWLSRVGVYAASSFQAARAGPAAFQLEAGGPVQIWIDGRQIKRDPDGGFHADLPGGIHGVVIRMDGQAMPASIRLRSSDVTFIVN